MKKKFLLIFAFGAICLALLLGSAMSSAEVFVETFPTNARGETYGKSPRNGDPGPDLVLAENAEGVVGYIRESECGGANSLEEAVNYVPQDRYVNMYLSDGETVVGQFFISAGSKHDIREDIQAEK